jgi:hypothetical protein
MNPGRGGPNPNLRFGNAGGSYKRGAEERDGKVDHREVDPRPKVRREADSGRSGMVVQPTASTAIGTAISRCHAPILFSAIAARRRGTELCLARPRRV